MGAWLFLNHDILYLLPAARPPGAPPAAYAIVTTIIYLFMRGVAIVSGLRLPQPAQGRVRKPTRYPAVRPIRRIIPAPVDTEYKSSPAQSLRAALAAMDWTSRSSEEPDVRAPLVLVNLGASRRLERKDWSAPRAGDGRAPR